MFLLQATDEDGANVSLAETHPLKYFMSASIIHLRDDISSLWVTLCCFKYMASEIELAWFFPGLICKKKKEMF